MSLLELQNNLAKEIFGMTPADARANNICIDCKAPIRDERGEDATGENGQIYSDAGFNEYCISGMCETCFDNMTGGK